MSPKILWTSFESPIGIVFVASTERGLCKVVLPGEGEKRFFRWIERTFPQSALVESSREGKAVVSQLLEYFKNKREKFDVALDFHGSDYNVRVWKELVKIPYGTTISYKQLAKRVGTPTAYQTVGHANGMNPIPIIVPCHRVIGSDGSMTGYGGGIKTKEYLLKLEGALML
jgi:methylated-DNA-[protein]-cysteine S-methyltransferase